MRGVVGAGLVPVRVAGGVRSRVGARGGAARVRRTRALGAPTRARGARQRTGAVRTRSTAGQRRRGRTPRALGSQQVCT